MAGRTEVTFLDKVDGGRRDIWRYARFYEPAVEPRSRLTLGEGWTTALEVSLLTCELGLDRLIFKREDLNPTGSHKARALAYQVSKASQEGKKALLISSSGNAAVAAAAYSSLAGIVLLAFISPKTNPVKVQEIVRLGGVVVSTERPINLAKYASRRYSIENLRPSTNDSSIEGFKSLGFEILETVGDVDAIFTFVSSGSSILGIAKAYRELTGMGEARMPRLFAVHAGALSPDEESRPRESARSSSLAGNLGVKKTRRASTVLQAVAESGGEPMLADDDTIRVAAEYLAKSGILTSPEGVASFAALREVASRGGIRRAVCILTGHSSQWPEAFDVDAAMIGDERELDRLIEQVVGKHPGGGR